MMQINCLGKILDLSQPQVMGILNLSPFSFAAVGRHVNLDDALRYAEQMTAEGAAIIDVGGEPSNPGVHPIISLQQELDRVIPVVEALAKRIAIPLSIDTSKAAVMREAISQGAGFINDVRALREPEALTVVAETQVPVCLMHMSFPDGCPPAALANQPDDTLLQEVSHFLASRVDACRKAGIRRDKILLDPGIGGGSFGKNLTGNLTLLSNLTDFASLGFPLLIGVSRKAFIGELLQVPVEDRLYGSLAAATVAVLNGANLIRAHDVKATVHAVKIAAAIRAQQTLFI